MQMQLCTIEDADKLAVLNKQLIDDEKSDNPMNINELKNRMEEFLRTDYNAYFFIKNNQVVGYALVNTNSNPIYLRQFFIDRNYRRQHYGKKAFQMLLKCLNLNKMDIEVLPWNEIGHSFWTSCGFKEISITMRYGE